MGFLLSWRFTLSLNVLICGSMICLIATKTSILFCLYSGIGLTLGKSSSVTLPFPSQISLFDREVTMTTPLTALPWNFLFRILYLTSPRSLITFHLGINSITLSKKSLSLSFTK